MNRFERECHVQPSLFRRTRDQLGRVDPLAVRAARYRAIAAYARVGRSCPVMRTAPSVEVVRQMERGAWRTYLHSMLAA